MTTNMLTSSKLLRSLALFPALLALALAAAGCSTDCASEPSQCSTPLNVHELCDMSDICTVDDAPASCTTQECGLPPGAKLVIDLERLDVSSSIPDLVIHNAEGALSPADVHIAVDGVEVAPEEIDGVDVIAHLGSGADSAKKLEVWISNAAGLARLALTFRDVQCEEDERAACNGGGG